MPRPFHIAIPVSNLAEARRFYGELIGCSEGRSTEDWIDFDMYGHQVVTHVTGEMAQAAPCGSVDGVHVPVPHFGVVLERPDWTALADRLRGGGMDFVVEPQVRYLGQVGEQATFFLFDPFGNALEFKSMTDDADLFAK